MKDFIKSRTALNHRELCRLIDWSPASFNQWLKGSRGIPDYKAAKLPEVLAQYGYSTSGGGGVKNGGN